MALFLQPPRVALVNATGTITREWYEFFRSAFERMGGTNGSSTTDLSQSDDDDSGLEEFKHEFLKSVDAQSVAPPACYELRIEQLETQLAELAALVAEQAKQIDALNLKPV
jgi:hypothetical protein